MTTKAWVFDRFAALGDRAPSSLTPRIRGRAVSAALVEVRGKDTRQ